MNKKDLINSFESLTPSAYQKEKMLNNVLSSGMEKNVHKMTFNFRYVFSTVVAAACVLAVVVAVGPMYKYHKLSQTPSQKVTTTDLTNDKAVIQPEFTEAEDAVMTDVAPPDKAAESKTAEERTKTHPTQESTPEADVAIVAEESIDLYSDSDINSRMIVMEEDAIKAYTPQLNLNHKPEVKVYYAPEVSATAGAAGGSSGGGGGGGYVNSEAILELDDETTNATYKNDFDIPEGYSKTTSKNGNQQTFRYANGNSYIYISATSDTSDVSQMLNSGYLTTDINGTIAVVFENGKEYTSYIISNNIAYTIDTYDVSEEDLANLLLSIAG